MLNEYFTHQEWLSKEHLDFVHFCRFQIVESLSSTDKMYELLSTKAIQEMMDSVRALTNQRAAFESAVKKWTRDSKKLNSAIELISKEYGDNRRLGEDKLRLQLKQANSTMQESEQFKITEEKKLLELENEFKYEKKNFFF